MSTLSEASAGDAALLSYSNSVIGASLGGLEILELFWIGDSPLQRPSVGGISFRVIWRRNLEESNG